MIGSFVGLHSAGFYSNCGCLAEAVITALPVGKEHLTVEGSSCSCTPKVGGL